MCVKVLPTFFWHKMHYCLAVEKFFIVITTIIIVVALKYVHKFFYIPPSRMQISISYPLSVSSNT